MISDCCRFSKTICKPEWCEVFPLRLKNFRITPPCFYSNKLDSFSVKIHTDTDYSFYDSLDVKEVFYYVDNNMMERADLEDTLKLIKIKNTL